jgi:hypothetical protein
VPLTVWTLGNTEKQITQPTCGCESCDKASWGLKNSSSCAVRANLHHAPTDQSMLVCAAYAADVRALDRCFGSLIMWN